MRQALPFVNASLLLIEVANEQLPLLADCDVGKPRTWIATQAHGSCPPRARLTPCLLLG